MEASVNVDVRRPGVLAATAGMGSKVLWPSGSPPATAGTTHPQLAHQASQLRVARFALCWRGNRTRPR